MGYNNIVELFRIVGTHYTYGSLAAVLDVSAVTVRGYLTGHIRPRRDRQYHRMRLVITAHQEGIAESALDLRPSRGASLSESRADQKHLTDCGRHFGDKRDLHADEQRVRRAA